MVTEILSNIQWFIRSNKEKFGHVHNEGGVSKSMF